MPGTFCRLACVALLAAACSAEELPAPAAGPLPETLAGTGLYAADGAIAPGVLSFTPQYPLWTDGATKRRWIFLPEGAAIDAADVDVWQFPVGTKVWKEFSFGGARAETRYMERTAAGWRYGTYAWSADGTTATLAPRAGAASVEIAPGVHHQLPSEADCRACHASAPTPVLGFSALQLSPDRDPNAPHRETPAPGSVDLATLAASGRLRNLAPEHLSTPPRIPGPPLERAALGYLHGNCGGCHRDDGPIATVGMVLFHSVGDPGAARRTIIGQPSRFMAPGRRVAPGAHAESVIVARMSARTPLEQMPPLGSQIVDADATRLLASWIDQLAQDPDTQEKNR